MKAVKKNKLKKSVWQRIKQQAKSKLQFKSLDSVGWLAFTIIFAALIYPGQLAAHALTYEQMSTPFSMIVLGLVIAAISAAVITWALNAVVTRLAELRKAPQKGKKRRK